MTTIAWRGDDIAGDTQSCEGWTRTGNGSKILRIGDVLAAGSGGSALCQRFRDWLVGGARGLPDLGNPEKDAYNAVGIVGLPGGVFVRFDAGLPPTWSTAAFYAIGSGREVAMGAMAAGATAAEAVRCAISLDIGSGGEVQVLSRRGR